jgi:hypothetical protein
LDRVGQNGDPHVAAIDQGRVPARRL